jgi:serine carboxypeptidase-like clade 2
VPGDLKCSLDDHKFRGAEIDCFNIYAPVCLQSRNGTNYSSSYVRKRNTTMPLPSISSSSSREIILQSLVTHTLTLSVAIVIFFQLPGYDPCTEHYIKSYLNNVEVQKALQARIGN